MKKLFAVFVLALLPIFSFGQARILNFSIKAEVQTNASAVITEEITVNAEHNQIRRGICRDIPQSNLEIKIQSLSMDGVSHPYFTENKGKDLRIN
ncbi:MAG: DUF2207 domain-containing protein [Elusimicrobiota bacterium]|jgi:spore coat protein CotH|nr:DUF2207 domain-containing protein [Elusimicrobiota bacterium]